MTWATDGTQAVVSLFRVASLGTTIIVDRQGHVSYRDGGTTTYEILKAQVEPFDREPPAVNGRRGQATITDQLSSFPTPAPSPIVLPTMTLA